MRGNVLEVEHYPEIRYECLRLSASTIGEGQYWISLNGDLTLHGVTRGQPVSARVSVRDNILRGSDEFTVRQSGYDIKPVSVAGVLKVKDELRLSFDIMARSS
ncbi:MAG TPA: YceI family protein [Candidatus Sulfotelmatobacter sp.]|nr:YceI family protein [Candidatus Sulfotelmatobacter sp.]